MKPNKFGSDKNPFAKVVKKAKGGAATDFGKAFAMHRARGDKEFTFEGRGKNTRFTTETEEEQTARKKKKTTGPTPAGYPPAAATTAAATTSAAPPAAIAKPAAPAPGRVGVENFGPKFDKILGAFSRYSDSAKQGDAAAKKSIAAGQADRMKAIMQDAAADKKAIAAGQAARMAGRAANIAKAKKDYDPSSSGSNLDVAEAQMGFKKGGESKAMMKKEVAFMKKKGAPKSMVKHETAEMKMAKGGAFRSSANGIAKKGKTKAAMPKMAKGGSIDGIAMRGKTRGCK